MGLVSKALPASELLAHAMAFARDLATHTAPHAVGAIKRMLYRHLQMQDRERALDEELELIGWAGSQPDTIEGVTAMLERREPRWTGSKSVELPDGIGSMEDGELC